MRVTNLNADLLEHRELSAIEEFWYESSFDGRKIQAWIVTPPEFDPSKKYPLVSRNPRRPDFQLQHMVLGRNTTCCGSRLRRVVCQSTRQHRLR